MGIRENMFVPKTFGDRLRQRMAELSITQKELGARSGCGQSNISRYIKGEQAPNMAQAVALANVLVCDLGWLAGMDSGGPTPEPTGADYVGPVSALEKTALSKALTVLRSKGVRGHPDQTLASNIETCFETVRYAEELGDNGGHVHGEGSAASSARRKRAR